MTLALRFISGKYQGGEFPLEDSRDVVVGRSSDLDMVLVEEMVSRKHARLCLRGSLVEIEDLGSTNGTFVNGERIHEASVGEGDRILIGSNILRVVALGDIAPAKALARELVEGPSVPAQRRGVRRPDGEMSTEIRMSGELEEIPLPDLLQLFATSKKDGVLLIDTGVSVGGICLKKGIVHHAYIRTDVEPPLAVPARKALYRMLAWETGVFELDPPLSKDVEKPLDATVQELLMDGFRLRDEMGDVLSRLPLWRSGLSLTHPLVSPLSALKPNELAVLQAALNQGTIGATMDASPLGDAETAELLISLAKRAYLSVSDPVEV